MPQIELNINGRDYTLDVEDNETLLTVLRERFDLTGAKPACQTGDWGACKVIIDGSAEKSCMKVAKKLAGKKIETIENWILHPWDDHVRQSFTGCQPASSRF